MLRLLIPMLLLTIPLLLTGGLVMRAVERHRMEVAWLQRRQKVDAFRAALHHRAAERDREAAEREAFDRKLRGEEDDNGDA